MYKKTLIVNRLWPIALIALLAFVLRAINLEQLFYFTYDEEIPAFVGRRLILWHHLPLIGGATPFGFHLGPYFYWFYSSLLFVGRLNPLMWGIAGAILSMATTLLIYIVGKNFFNKRVGVTAAIFWAFSFLANVYDRHLWALSWGPITCLLVLYFLYKIISAASLSSPRSFLSLPSPLSFPRKRESSTFYTILLAVTLALSIHADPSNLIFIGLTVLALISLKVDKLSKKLFTIFFFLLISIAPLVFFDLRHDFANIKPVANYLKASSSNSGINAKYVVANALLFPQTLTRLTYTFGDNEVNKQYSYCRNFIAEKFAAVPPLLVFGSSILLIAFMVISFRSRHDPAKKSVLLLAFCVLLYFVGILAYGTLLKGDIFEHYIAGLFPVLLLVLAFFVAKLPKLTWLFVIGLFITLNLYKLSMAVNSQGLMVKREAIQYTMQEVGDKPFSLDSLSTCWKWNGYRYLFTVFGREPVKSYVDPNFAYLYGTTPVAEKHPATVVSFVVHDFAPETPQFYNRYKQLKSHEISSKTFGSIEVIIMDNSTGWFK